MRPPDQGGEPSKSRRIQLWNEKEHLERAIDEAKTVNVSVVAESRCLCYVSNVLASTQALRSNVCVACLCFMMSGHRRKTLRLTFLKKQSPSTADMFSETMCTRPRAVFVLQTQRIDYHHDRTQDKHFTRMPGRRTGELSSKANSRMMRRPLLAPEA